MKIFLLVLAALVFVPGLTADLDWVWPYLPVVGIVLIMAALGQHFGPAPLARRAFGVRGHRRRGQGGMFSSMATNLATSAVATTAQMAVAMIVGIGRGVVRLTGHGGRWFVATRGRSGGHQTGHSGFPSWPLRDDQD